MMKRRFRLLLLSAVLMLAACQPQSDYAAKVTRVNHTPVKRQAIGNCWLYAHATWLESLLKHTTGQDINVSESYWTYWDFYEKLLAKEAIPEGELNTSGSWYRSSTIIRKYGWLEEGEFIAFEAADVMSKAQDCAEAYLIEQGKPGGTLADLNQRTPEMIRTELDKAFSCNGAIRFNMDGAWERRRKAEDTHLIDVKSGHESSLAVWLKLWREISSPGNSSWGLYEGKKLITPSEFDAYKSMEQRIKKALNDHQPVVLTFFVSFNAPDRFGYFNLNSLAQAGSMGDSGGHMVVLHDYSVKDIPGLEGQTYLGEGDLSAEEKEAALTGNLDYLVAKNSWGYNRLDRPWLRDGYSRISWDYLLNRYYDEDTRRFQPFLRSVVLPPGY